MVGDNKILTVSYGTFSCTLEGFDDPFSMMKAIAEYFRDLTAGDRFFGAEPPQPDAETLERIAKQSVDTPVDVQVSENMMILRNANGDGGAQPVTAPPAVAAVAAALASSPAEGAAPLVSTPASAPVSKPAFGQGDSIAEKLQRIRAVVSREVTDTEKSAVADLSEASFSEDQHADEFAEDDTSEPFLDVVSEETAGFEDQATEVAPEVKADATVEQELDTVDDDAMDSALNEGDSTEDVVAETAEAEELFEVEDASEENAPEMDGLASVAQGAQVEEEDSSAESLMANVADSLSEATAETKAFSYEDLDTETTADTEADTEEDQTAAETAQDASSETDEDAADLEAALTDALAEDAEDAAEVKPRRRIIVQKISRADVEAAQPGAQSDTEQTSDEASSADLSPEAEAALMKELEAVEAEIETAESTNFAKDAVAFVERKPSDAIITAATSSGAKVTSKLRPGETEEQRAARLERRALMVEDEDAALNRLMDATSSKLSDDDEGAVRRASIAHLKAAVAATKADESIAQAAADEEERELDQYRSDLAQVVIPSKSKPLSRDVPKDGDAARSRPLMLVSEQRIDDPADEPATVARDIRSRPVTAGNLALQEQVDVDEVADAIAAGSTEDFGTFAAKFGPLELPELLEAAAAHFTYVEGTGSFTRPMLMRKISTVADAENTSREAGLRSFGALLREGKLVKGDDGKFVISGSSRFAPEARDSGA